MSCAFRCFRVSLLTLSLALAACAPGEDAGRGDEQHLDEKNGLVAVARAREWVDARMPYCGGVQGGWDVLCGRTCVRTGAADDPAWNAYRSDCSGLVSWAWALPPPGRTTWMFAPFDTSITFEIPGSELQPGDALNNANHVVLFGGWIDRTAGRARILEESTCDTVATDRERALFVDDSSSVVLGSTVFTAIRYQAILPGGGKPEGGAIPTSRFDDAGKWLSGFGEPDWAATGDFDGDRKDDVAWYHDWDGQGITVALSTGDRFAVAGKWIDGVAKPDWAGVGDFDGDGDDDIAWFAKADSGSVTVLRSNGHAFEPGGVWVSGISAPDWAGVGDFDGNGNADLAWYEEWNDHSISVLQSTGAELFHGGFWASQVSTPGWAAVADATGDGLDDLLWYRDDEVAVIAAAPSVEEGNRFAAPASWVSGWGAPDWAGAGDFDHDGAAEVAWSVGWNDHALSVALGSDGVAGATSKWKTGWGKPSWAGTGDFDGDGRADVLWYEAWNDGAMTVGLAR